MTPSRAMQLSAPVLAAAILSAMLGVNSVRGPRKDDLRAYLDNVRDVIERTPYQIGEWSGKDIEPPPAAQRLLKPNKILQRRYTDASSGRSINLLIVHCADVRDMLGHYPPVCYPAHGWAPMSADDDGVQIDGSTYPARRYAFRRSAQGAEQSISILGFFVVPDSKTQIVSTNEDLDTIGQLGPAVGLGSGQVQIVADERMPEAERRQAERQIMRAIEPVIRAIATGADHARR